MMYERESTARHSTAKTMKIKPKNSKRKKIPRPLSGIICCLIELLAPVKKKKSNSRALFVSYAAGPSRDHFATGSVLVKPSSLSATL